MKIRILPSARQDLVDGYEFMNQVSQGLGIIFSIP